jgi:hypothetical protein
MLNYSTKLLFRRNPVFAAGQSGRKRSNTDLVEEMHGLVEICINTYTDLVDLVHESGAHHEIAFKQSPDPVYLG